MQNYLLRVGLIKRNMNRWSTITDHIQDIIEGATSIRIYVPNEKSKDNIKNYLDTQPINSINKIIVQHTYKHIVFIVNDVIAIPFNYKDIVHYINHLK